MRGAGMIKVVGILMIVFGGLGLVFAFVALAGISTVVQLAEALGTEVNKTMLYLATFLSLLAAAVQLLTGIMGVANCRKPEKMGTLTILVFVMLILAVVAFVFALVNKTNIASAVFSMLVGMVLPILMLTGIKKNA